MVVVAAGTRIHRSDEHEGTGVGDGLLGSRDVDDAVLERLSQHLKNGTAELRQFIEEKYAVVRQANLAGLWIGSAAYQGHLRYGVVWRAEGTLGDEGTAFLQLACYRVNLRRLQTFAKRQGRQDAWQTLRHHALSASRRAYHDEVVAACCRYLDGTLHLLLPLHVGKVKLEVTLTSLKISSRIDGGGLHGLCAVQMTDDLIDVAHAVNMQIVDNRSLADILLGHEKTFESHLAGSDGDG